MWKIFKKTFQILVHHRRGVIINNFVNLLAAKSDISDKTKWLPLVIHAQDTANIIRKLFKRWLADSLKQELVKNTVIPTHFHSDVATVEKLCFLIALLHDIGKITPAFQSMISKNIENHTEFLSKNSLDITGILESKKSSHKIAGYVILEENNFPREISVIIGFHHGRVDLSQSDTQMDLFKQNYFGKDCYSKNSQEKLWRSLWNDWISYALNETGFTLDTLPIPNVKAQMILTGLLIMADWIASNTYYFPYINFGDDLDSINLNARADNAWELLDFPDILDIQDCCNSPEIFEKRFGVTPYSMQRQVMNIVSKNTSSGLYILEAPMGLGKTETALVMSEILIDRVGAGGIFFGLPTQATANGIFGRIRDWASKCDSAMHSIRLAHGMTELNDEYKALFKGKASGISSDSDDDNEDNNKNIIVHEWFEGRKQALLSDFVIATIDQFLLASLKQKHVMLRHLGLAGKVVILDECHAYDAYMNVYLDHTLTWMGAYGVPVILLSATLPPNRRNELIRAYMNKPAKKEIESNCNSLAYPVLTCAINGEVTQESLSCDIPEKKISIQDITEENLSSYLTEKLQDGGCAAVIVNTVAYAQELSKMLKSELQDYKVICFHSRFIATDRAEIEKNLLKNVGKNSNSETRNKLIVVGTQVIEQSLDLDFDTMITELCPMDLLLQRSGRLHRHKRKRPKNCEKPVLAILKPSEPKKSIYDEWILQQTEKYLPHELVIPSCIPELVSKVYATPESSEQTEVYGQYTFKIDEKKYQAEKYCIRSNMLDQRRKNLITKFLDNDAGNSSDAEASVRDTDETIEVLVLQKESEIHYRLISGKYSFNITSEINENEEKLIARERLNLPRIFSEKYNWNKVMEELQTFPKRWQNAKLLKREIMLLLDSNLETELIGKKLRYSKEFGLELLKNEVN